MAAVGASLTGAGWALVYPAFGSEAVRRLGGENKGVAMATYFAFPELAIGLASPLLGLSIHAGQIGTVFLLSSGLVMIAVPIAFIGKRRAKRI